MAQLRLTSALACALLAATAGWAAASPTPIVHPPDGWAVDAEQAGALGKSVTAERPLGDPAATVATGVYVPPAASPSAAAGSGGSAALSGGAKITLVVTRVTSHRPGDHGVAARTALDDLHGEVARATMTGGKPVEDTWAAGSLDAAKQLQGDLAWHDSSAGTRTDAHLVLAADAATLVAVTGECVAASDVAPALIAACRAALTTLDAGIPIADRVDLAAQVAAAGSDSAAVTAAPGPTVGSAPAAGSADPLPGPSLGASHLSDASKLTLPPIAIPAAEPQTDRRPVYLGAGLMALAALFYWNRRRRERFEPEAAKDDATDDR